MATGMGSPTKTDDFEPPSFDSNTNLPLWRRKVELYLATIPTDFQGPYILSLLSDDVQELVWACDLPTTATAGAIWHMLDELYPVFDDRTEQINEPLADRAHKLMPSITTYNLNDSTDGEDLSSSQESVLTEPAVPLACHSPNLSNTDGTNQLTDGVLPSLSESPSEYSSSSSDEEREVAFSRLAKTLVTVPVTEPINSGEFSALRKRLSQHISAATPVSAYDVVFQEIHPIVKSEHSTIKFGELTRSIAAQWDALSHEQKRDYRRSGARFNQDESYPLLAYKSRLHKSAEIQLSCCYPSCNKPIKWDPGQRDIHSFTVHFNKLKPAMQEATMHVEIPAEGGTSTEVAHPDIEDNVFLIGGDDVVAKTRHAYNSLIYFLLLLLFQRLAQRKDTEMPQLNRPIVGH